MQLGSVANDQLALNHAARTAARAISLADINEDSAQTVAISVIESEINLENIDINAQLFSNTAKVELNYSRKINLPIIGMILQPIDMRASATMPRELPTS